MLRVKVQDLYKVRKIERALEAYFEKGFQDLGVNLAHILKYAVPGLENGTIIWEIQFGNENDAKSYYELMESLPENKTLTRYVGKEEWISFYKEEYQVIVVMQWHHIDYKINFDKNHCFYDGILIGDCAKLGLGDSPETIDSRDIFLRLFFESEKALVKELEEDFLGFNITEGVEEIDALRDFLPGYYEKQYDKGYFDKFLVEVFEYFIGY